MRTRAHQVAVLLFDEVELLDVAAFAAVFSVAGRHWNWRPFKLFAASAGGGTVPTRSQLALAAHGTLTECPAPEILIVPGGYGARRLLDRSEVIDWLRQASAAARVIAAVGYGALPLAKAGVVASSRLAIPLDVHELARELAPASELVTGERWVASDRILTARASAAALDVALEIVTRTLGSKHSTMVAEQLGHVVAPTRIEALDLGLGKKPPV